MDDEHAGDETLVRKAVEQDLIVHVRLEDQGLAPDPDRRRALAREVPSLSAFGDNTYAAVRAILDWDHRLPSNMMFLRILASYEQDDAAHLQRRIDEQTRTIDGDNLYPEFDLPDYGIVEADEVYAGLITVGSTTFQDFRLLSEWRKHVDENIADMVIDAVRESTSFQAIEDRRQSGGLGGPIIVGWTPPSLADADHWAIEVWLVTDFDGRVGQVHVFMVDSVSGALTREFDTAVQIA